jgi:predicted glycogen debranching enzyme
MGYIEFDKSELVNLEYSLDREILRTSRTGSYSSSTIVGCNTRKYHGLLVSPVDSFDGERYVLLSTLDVSVAQNDMTFNIGIHKFSGEHFSPRGHKYLKEFSADPVPAMQFEVGTVVVRQERVMSSNSDQVLIKYTLVSAPGKVMLQFRPLLAFRKIHELTYSNLYVNRKVGKIANGIRIKMYEGFPYLHMQFSKEADFVPVPDWIKDVEYPEEQARGYDFKEDLYRPGYFEAGLNVGESLIFSASTEEIKPAGLKRKFTSETYTRVARDNFRNCLINSANQFIIRRGGDTDIIAGYHWFGSWGRDTFISLPGLSLSLGDIKTFRDVMDTQVKRMKKGLFPNMGTPSNPAFNSVDAPMWFIWAVQQYSLSGGKDAWTRYGKAVREVIDSYIRGTSFGIEMHQNGLIYAGAEGKALTWMDAINSEGPVTPRAGYNVEINALWYNALSYALEMSDAITDKAFRDRINHLPGLVKNSFLEMFWYEEGRYLADYVDRHGERNLYVRPNMVFATSLPYRMLSPEMTKDVLARIEKELLTERGLRTLSPKNPDYKGIYSGNQDKRDAAYHQGTVWPWLVGHFCEGYLELYGSRGIEKVNRIINGFEDVMFEHGISSVSEIYDGDPPHQPRGAISQAWSVGELLRVIDLIDQKTAGKEMKK